MNILVKNKRAHFDYEIIDTYDAGMVLQGHEVKAVKLQGANLRDAIVILDEREIYVVNLDIPLYKKAQRQILGNYNPKGRRKLLLTKQQRTRLWERTQKTGFAIIPLHIYEAKNRRLKLTIALAKRKKNIQKKAAIKEKDDKRSMQRDLRHLG